MKLSDHCEWCGIVATVLVLMRLTTYRGQHDVWLCRTCRGKIT